MLVQPAIFTPPSPWVLDEDGPTITFYIRRHTVIRTMQIAVVHHTDCEAAQSLDTSGDAGDVVSTLAAPLHHRSSVSNDAQREYVLWCTVVPTKARQSADAVYRAHPSFALGSFAVPRHGDAAGDETTTVLTVPIPHWEVAAGSTVKLSLHVHEPLACDSAAAHSSASTRNDRKAGESSSSNHDNVNSNNTDRDAHPSSSNDHCGRRPCCGSAGQHTPLSEGHTLAATTWASSASVRFHLSGLSDGPSFMPAMCEWRALLCHRWFQVKSHIRSATMLKWSWRRHSHTARIGGIDRGNVGRHDDNVSDDDDDDKVSHDCVENRKRHRDRYHASHRRRRDDSGEDDEDNCARGRCRASSTRVEPLYAGEVREAVALSANGAFVRWANGSMSPMDELQLYRRFFAPAHADKMARVRRYPHRYADVVGVIPYNTTVEAFGLTVDAYTGERYVCVYLPHGTHGEDDGDVVSTYDLKMITRPLSRTTNVAGVHGSHSCRTPHPPPAAR